MVDPITRAVLANELRMITEEMAEYLVRSSYSANIKNRRDCSCAIYDAEGNMVAQGLFMPAHLGVMSSALKALLEVVPVDTLNDGDALVHNDPYLMGAHLFDVMIFKPLFQDGKLFAWVGSTAHQVDMGGAPGGVCDGTIHQEGLRLTGLHIMRNGKVEDEVIRLICANVRTPYDVRGDVMAEVAANYRGEQRIMSLAEKYGTEKLGEYFNAIMDYSERGMRAAIAALPDGEADFEDCIETNDKNNTEVLVKVHVSIKGDTISLDFNGTGAPTRGNVNAPLSITKSACYYAVRAAIGCDIDVNAGAYRAIQLVPFENVTILNSTVPYAVGACTTIPSQRTVDLVLGALSKLIPERVCACDGQWDGVGFTGVRADSGELFAYTETYGAGRGAHYNSDGANAHQTHMTNSSNAPTEIIELEQPFLIESYSLAPGSAGAGKFRGGNAIQRSMRCLEDTYITALISRSSSAPYGLFGGLPGSHDSSSVVFPDGTYKDHVTSELVPAGTVVTFRTSGGGGWGDPKERDVTLIEKDLQYGYIDTETAEKVYGYVAPDASNGTSES